MCRNVLIIQESSNWVIFLTVIIVFTTVFPASTFSVPLSARVPDADDASLKETSRLKVVGQKPSHYHNSPRHFHHHQHTVSRAQQTYALLKSLRKIQGYDGLSPVCRLCETNFVDAKTYDYFCLPDSDGVDGVTCDTLTFLGTTTENNIHASCKHLMPRVTLTCK